MTIEEHSHVYVFISSVVKDLIRACSCNMVFCLDLTNLDLRFRRKMTCLYKYNDDQRSLRHLLCG